MACDISSGRGHGQHRGMCGIRCQADPACAGTERCLAAQPGSPRHALAAADHQHVAEIALVRCSWPGRQQLGRQRFVDTAHDRSLARPACLWNIQILEDQLAAVTRGIVEKQTGFQADEGHGQIGPDRAAQHLAGIAVDSGWHVERNYGGRVRVYRRHRLGEGSSHGPLESAAEYPVDQHLRVLVELAGPALYDTAFGLVVLVGPRRITGQGCRIDQRQDRNDDAFTGRQARDHVAVTGIVAGAADNLPALRIGKSLSRRLQRRRTRTRHQRIAWNAVVLDRGAVDLANGRDGIDVDGQGLHRAIILSGGPDLALTMSTTQYGNTDMAALKAEIVDWAIELGFQQLGVSDIDLDTAEQRLETWLASGYHGSMDYMHRHGMKRSRPDELVPGTLRVISARMDYLPEHQDTARRLLDDESRAYISRYALGRDYHKVMRRRLQALAHRIEERIGEFGYRVFVDSAPVLEKALAEKAGLGWIGKHTNLINREHGSWFFLGELYTDLPLPVDAPEVSHCGSCSACIDVCPTGRSSHPTSSTRGAAFPT